MRLSQGIGWEISKSTSSLGSSWYSHSQREPPVGKSSRHRMRRELRSASGIDGIESLVGGLPVVVLLDGLPARLADAGIQAGVAQQLQHRRRKLLGGVGDQDVLSILICQPLSADAGRDDRQPAPQASRIFTRMPPAAWIGVTNTPASCHHGSTSLT